MKETIYIEECDVISEMFGERVCNSLTWFRHSRSLLASARATQERAEMLIDIWEKSDLENVASMLYGFSLENLFKAIWILNKYGSPYNEDWIPEPEFPKKLKTHNLVELAKLIDVNLVEKYEFSLSMLSETTTWSGRYPCSLKGVEGTIGRWSQINIDAEKIFKAYSKPFTSFC